MGRNFKPRDIPGSEVSSFLNGFLYGGLTVPSDDDSFDIDQGNAS